MYEQLALGTPVPERESSETQRCLKSLGFAANIVAGAPMSKAGGGLAGSTVRTGSRANRKARETSGHAPRPISPS